MQERIRKESMRKKDSTFAPLRNWDTGITAIGMNHCHLVLHKSYAKSGRKKAACGTKKHTPTAAQKTMKLYNSPSMKLSRAAKIIAAKTMTTAYSSLLFVRYTVMQSINTINLSKREVIIYPFCMDWQRLRLDGEIW